MENSLNNPVYSALCTGDAHRAQGTEKVKLFHPEVSPFAGFEEGYAGGFEDLHHILPPGRNILYATRRPISQHKGWKLIQHVAGFQFVLSRYTPLQGSVVQPVPLQKEHVSEMMQLAALTRPGPFNTRTIEFGNYFGIIHNGKLVAMTGQRLHVETFTEVSAVCTHPDHRGKGYAAALLDHQLQLILSKGQTPFLHVRGDNSRAIAIYQKMGFVRNGDMNFYFLQRSDL